MDDRNYRLALIDSPNKDGIVITIVHKDRDQGALAFLNWDEAIMLADRIYAKCNNRNE